MNEKFIREIIYYEDYYLKFLTLKKKTLRKNLTGHCS